jgi:hypothetical protein
MTGDEDLARLLAAGIAVRQRLNEGNELGVAVGGVGCFWRMKPRCQVHMSLAASLENLASRRAQHHKFKHDG